MFINDLEKEVNREVTNYAVTNLFSEVKMEINWEELQKIPQYRGTVR